ncbi:hypothetical protein M9H77_29466 [Catharanthus roseus]|uniref:Uncharacterized protein n=1 Tax=Catharanthus roseus TaxID=4058 RepID=A0ACB9ZVA2_CATRO|nr:hypothetical protein M9H77_29466 [Catharanthus roseus]
MRLDFGVKYPGGLKKKGEKKRWSFADMNQDGQGDEKLQGSMARARKIKENDYKVAHGLMIAIEETMKDGLKFKNEVLEDDENPPKLLMVQCLNLEQPMEQITAGDRPCTYYPL